MATPLTDLTKDCCPDKVVWETTIGAVLSQVDDDGLDRPVAHYSRKLLDREKNYAAVNKEFSQLWTA